MTGGTIATARSSQGLLGMGPIDRLATAVLEGAERVGVTVALFTWQDVQGREKPPLDSADFTPPDWTDLARQTADLARTFDGVLILHGTDTLAYTAAALAFALDGYETPIVITGAQRALEHVRPDGPDNIRLGLAALNQAAAARRGGVTVAFGGRLFPGARVYKFSAHSLYAFRSSSSGGKVEEALMPAPTEPRPKGMAFDSRVVPVWVVPGLSAEAVSLQLETARARGVLLMLHGVGSAPRALAASCDRWRTQGLLVAAVSQARHGRMAMSSYESTRRLLEAGVVPADMLAEAALVKIMWLLAQTTDVAQASRWMAFDLVGETGR